MEKASAAKAGRSRKKLGNGKGSPKGQGDGKGKSKKGEGIFKTQNQGKTPATAIEVESGSEDEEPITVKAKKVLLAREAVWGDTPAWERRADCPLLEKMPAEVLDKCFRAWDDVEVRLSHADLVLRNGIPKAKEGCGVKGLLTYHKWELRERFC